MRRFFIFLFLAAVVIYSRLELPAQELTRISPMDSLAIETIFAGGVDSYRRGRYDEAYLKFKQLYSMEKEHIRSTATHLMMAKTLYKMGDYYGSIDLAKMFIKKHSESSYIDDIHYLLAQNFFRLHEFNNSVAEFFWVYLNSTVKKLSSRAFELGTRIAESKLSSSSIRELRDRTLDRELEIYLTLLLARKLLEEGKDERATDEASRIMTLYPENIYSSDFNKIIDRDYFTQERKVKIGLVLPVTGAYAEDGLKIFRGIEFYFKTRVLFSYGIETVLLDNEGDPVKTVMAIQKLAEDPSVIAVIGPVMSANAVSAASSANALKVPLISPTATENGIASIGEYIFQANVDLETRGRILATYAVKNLGLKTFAIISPADQYGKNLTDSFAASVDELGGKIVTETWYYGVPEDLRQQFSQIRKVGFDLMARVRPETLSVEADTISVIVDTTLLRIKDAEEKENVDSSKIIINSIDGIYFPIHDDDIKYIAPQYAFYNIKTQLLGDGNWYDIQQLGQHKSYIDGLIFASDYFIDTSDVSYSRFVSQFRQLMGYTPGRIEMYGYNTCGMLVEAILSGPRTRESLRQRLSQIDSYQGILGRIVFNEYLKRVNSSLFILQYTNGRIQRLN